MEDVATENLNKIMSEDIAESRLLPASPNKDDYVPFDIYHRMTNAERKAMQDKLEKNTIRFSNAMDELILPKMPKNKKSKIKDKRNLLKIISERQARLQAQIEWIRSEQEKYRNLRGET